MRRAQLTRAVLYFCGIMADVKGRLVSVAELTAESLEAEANAMPPSFKEQAESLRKIAKTFREKKGTKMMRVWEEQPEQKKPSSAAHS
jgi:hypothetical protein